MMRDRQSAPDERCQWGAAGPSRGWPVRSGASDHRFRLALRARGGRDSGLLSQASFWQWVTTPFLWLSALFSGAETGILIWLLWIGCSVAGELAKTPVLGTLCLQPEGARKARVPGRWLADSSASEPIEGKGFVCPPILIFLSTRLPKGLAPQRSPGTGLRGPVVCWSCPLRTN